jgi:uracil-DNA glycosylase family 4
MAPHPLAGLNTEIVGCTRCSRLVAWREEIARKKVRRFMDWEYWGRPVPGFGDPNAELLIVGLAPAAHGANRTGRMFTGDDSGNWLYRALYETGYANQPESYAIQDGLKLTGCYVTATCRCAPPQNRVTTEEIRNCSTFLSSELRLLSNLRVILCLGRVAFGGFCRIRSLAGLQFGHNVVHPIPNGQTLISSYHPSRQNTQTGKLKWKDWIGVFERIRRLSESALPVTSAHS